MERCNVCDGSGRRGVGHYKSAHDITSWTKSFEITCEACTGTGMVGTSTDFPDPELAEKHRKAAEAVDRAFETKTT